MGSKPSLPRGMRDVEPDEMAVRTWLYERFNEVFRRYGFKLVEPSPIEALETLEAKSGPSIRKEIYWFKDKGGRLLGLRFDLTVGLARMVAGRFDLPQPVKLAAISNMWRYDEPQHGRYRCFYQWDAEIFGSPLPDADAEIIALSMDMLEAVRLKNFEVRISSRRLAEGFLNTLGVTGEERVEAVLRIIDKYRKQSLSQLRSEFAELGLKDETISEIFNFIGIQLQPEKALERLGELKVESEKFSRGLEEISKIVDCLKALGKDSRLIVDMSIVRGLGYYDGPVFEIYDRGDVGLGALVGGGRYDGLCKLYGRDMPATGAAGGIERTLLALEKAGVKPEIREAALAFVAAVKGEVRSRVLEIVAWLRGEGIPVDYDLKGRNLKSQLEYADSLRIPYVLIVGPREAASGTVRLREMETRVERELSLKEAAAFLKGRLAGYRKLERL